MPLHGVAVGIMQNERDMIKADNLAKRFGCARQQTSQVCAAGDRMRERHNGPIEGVPAGAVLAADPDDGIRRCDGLDLFHHAPHGFAAAGDIVKTELAPVLGSRSTFSMTYPPLTQPTDRAPNHDASFNSPNSAPTSYRALVPRSQSQCAPNAAESQPYIVMLPIESMVKAALPLLGDSRSTQTSSARHWR